MAGHKGGRAARRHRQTSIRSAGTSTSIRLSGAAVLATLVSSAYFRSVLAAGHLDRDATDALGVSSYEHSAIFAAKHMIGTRSARSDCFREAAALTKTRCGKHISTEQSSKVAVAIALTQCELATAGQNMPLECRSYLDSQRDGEDTRDTEAAACVVALSRSAQFWSTYSGYLREAPTLCLIMRQEEEEASASRLYRAIADEKMALLRALERMRRTAERERADVRRESDARMARMERYLARFDESVHASSIALGRAAQDAAAAATVGSVETLQLILGRHLQDQLSAIGTANSLEWEAITKQLSQSLRDEMQVFTRSHAETLQSLGQMARDALLEVMSQSKREASQLQEHLTRLHTSLSLTEQSAVNAHNALRGVHGKARQLDDTLTAASLSLSSLRDEVNHMRSTQQETGTRLEQTLDRIEAYAAADLAHRQHLDQQRAEARQRGAWWWSYDLYRIADWDVEMSSWLHTIYNVASGSLQVSNLSSVGLMLSALAWRLVTSNRAAWLPLFRTLLQLVVLAVSALWALTGLLVKVLGTTVEHIARPAPRGSSRVALQHVKRIRQRRTPQEPGASLPVTMATVPCRTTSWSRNVRSWRQACRRCDQDDDSDLEVDEMLSLSTRCAALETEHH
ncbi:unnamed protein product [Parajaminaea phylloscopi]